MSGLRAALRPYDPQFLDAMRRRWDDLPEAVRTPGQVLGRHGVGCEGTHGVFPKCNLACTPCYHSRDANAVRVDGAHTLREITAQMRLLRDRRGPRAHAQLIGGEVSLLTPDEHAAALLAMRAHGREPMSFTHGDVDPSYLHDLVLDDEGRRRLDRVSFAVHFDTTMKGRRGIPRAQREAELDPYRARFVRMMRDLRRAHGVRFFLAHNMTVTPANVDEVADVIRANRDGWSMFSFQPAAYMGDAARWDDGYREFGPDQVWAEIERGAGAGLDFHVLEHGDTRCNRTAYGFFVGDTWFPLLDGGDPRDLAVRDMFFRFFGGMNFTGTAPALLALRLARVVARHPSTLTRSVRWVGRAVRRVGLRRLVRERRVRPVTFVMHSFMDAADVAPAWDALQRGERCADPRLAETQDRLRACHYAMAHPETGELVPACVQHGVLDPGENAALRRLLPLLPTAR